MNAKLAPAPETPRDIIYAELDDEITTLFERVRHARHKHIVLIIPSRAQILQSLVNLKILRYKSENIGKVITLITKDSAGRALAFEAGLATAERAKINNKQVEISEVNFPPRLEAHRNPNNDTGKPQKLGRRRLNITETVENVKAKLKKISRDEIPLGRLTPLANARRLWHRLAGGITEDIENDGGQVQFIVRAPSRRLLFALLGAASLLLFFVIYIAVPTATVYIVPRADPINKVVNITLTDQTFTEPRFGSAIHTISAKFFDFNLERDIRIGATGQTFEGENASGAITIYNRSPREKFIVPSRFLSADGIVFHTTRALTIPQQIGDIPGSVTAEVIACERDDTKCDCINEAAVCGGEFIGDRGNIGQSFFTIPAIPSLSPALYWAESTTPMTGGITKITKFISEADLTNIEETAVIEINNLAREKLRQLVAQKNEIESRHLTLLEDQQLVKVKILNLIVPSGLTGSQQDSFTVGVTASVSGVAYDDDLLRALLYEQLTLKVHPEKILTKVNFKKPAYRIEKADLKNHSVKLAMTAEGVEEYEIKEITDSGARFTEKIRNRILGKTVLEAEAYIRNLPEIDNATISSWPFWARTIPELPENIRFRDRD